MAKINDGTMRDWNNGDTVTSDGYEQDRELLRVAINDNNDRIIPLEGLPVRVENLETNVNGVLVPVTFGALEQQNFDFNTLRFGYVDDKLGTINEQLADIAIQVKPSGGDDTATIQSALNSLKGKTGKILFPSNSVFLISSTLIVPESIELLGTLSTKFGRTGSDVPTTIFKWTGATNGVMLKYQKDSSTIVWGSKIRDISFDGNSIAGVTALDMRNSEYGLVENCNFTQVSNGIYFTWSSAYNTISRCTFEYFDGIAINLDDANGYANDNIFTENVFSFTKANAIGFKIKGGNSNKLVLNRFEAYATGIQPIHIEGTNAQDTVIAFNRFEHEWHLNTGQTPIYMITIKNVSGKPRYTKLLGNQFYPQEHDPVNDITKLNFNYVLIDEGYGTICDDYVDDNYIPNGSLKPYNGTIPVWKSNDSSLTFSFDSVEDAVKVVVNNSSIQYPSFYNIIDAKKLRNRNVLISILIKCTDNSTKPNLGVEIYKNGDGTLANLGSYIGGRNDNMDFYKVNDYMLLVSSLDIPSDADNIYVYLNTNGMGSPTPANNTFYIKFISISDKRAFKVNPNKDLIMNHLKMVYPTSSRPTGTKGMTIIDSTLNKMIWHDGTNWRDAMGTIV